MKLWKCICPIIEIWALPLKNTSCTPAFSRYVQNMFKASLRRLQDVFETSWRCSTEDKLVFFNITGSHLQDVFKMFSRHLRDVFKTSSRWIIQGKYGLLTRFQHVFRTHFTGEYLQKDSPWAHFLWNLWSWYKSTKSELIGYTKTVFGALYVITAFTKQYTLTQVSENLLLSQIIKN